MANSKCRKQCLLKNGDLPFQILIYNAHEKVCFGLPLSCQHYINETLKNGGFCERLPETGFIEPAKTSQNSMAKQTLRQVIRVRDMRKFINTMYLSHEKVSNP